MGFKNLQLFCFGLGYVAQRLSDALLERGAHVVGTQRRSSDRTIAWDGLSPLPSTAQTMLAESNALLISIPPQQGKDSVIQHAGAWLAEHAQHFNWVGYLSSTGVYGDTAGAWVDETTPPHPHDARTRARWDAEQAWQELCKRHGLPVHVFRLAGIYGPSRNAIVQLREGETKRCVHKEGQVFSRVHVDDIVQVVMASLQKPMPGAVYNVCDDLPTATHDVLAYACEAMGVALPPCIDISDADLSPMGASFYAANRRVKNDKIKAELGVALRYPTYREGLSALLATDGE